MIETLTGGLHASAKRELTTLLQQMSPSSYTLTAAPTTLEELSQALEAHKCALHPTCPAYISAASCEKDINVSRHSGALPAHLSRAAQSSSSELRFLLITQ